MILRIYTNLFIHYLADSKNILTFVSKIRRIFIGGVYDREA